MNFLEKFNNGFLAILMGIIMLIAGYGVLWAYKISIILGIILTFMFILVVNGLFKK